MSEISAVWERIEAWYEAQGASHLLNPGASAEAIAQAEKQLGLTFPAELTESLMRHDGSAGMSWPGGDLLSLEGIARERSVWMELLESDIFSGNADHNETSTLIQSGWWNPGWIPSMLMAAATAWLSTWLRHRRARQVRCCSWITRSAPMSRSTTR